MLELIVCFRLAALDSEFSELLDCEARWPSPLPELQKSYAEFYEALESVRHNFVCACCGCLSHDVRRIRRVSVFHAQLLLLAVPRDWVPFDFGCGNAVLDAQNILIDKLGLSPGLEGGSDLTLCDSCHTCLCEKKKLPPAALANHRWIGDVPEELRRLNWLEESLVAKFRYFGKVVRLQSRRFDSYHAVKGHMVVVPQDTTELLELLPTNPDRLVESMRVVWVGAKPLDKSVIDKYFTVTTANVLAALRWLCDNHSDYKNGKVTIDRKELDGWPPVFVTKKLVESMASLSGSASEDASRSGVAVEETDRETVIGNLPLSASAILDTNSIASAPDASVLTEVLNLHLSEGMSTAVPDQINVVSGKTVVHASDTASYFTSAFPCLFAYGTGGHLVPKPPRRVSLSRADWVRLMLNNSSGRFQSHSTFVAACFNVARLEHSSLKVWLQTSYKSWETTEPLLASLTLPQLSVASKQASKHEAVTDPAVKALLNKVSLIGRSFPGSDAKKACMLAELKSSIVRYGCPVVFLTLNPGEQDSPLALYYAGEKINMSDFDPGAFPDSARLRTMMANPLATVMYFHNTVKAVIDGPLKGGLFGELQFFYGPVEYQVRCYRLLVTSQGRGTPHVHLLLWIKGASNPEDMRRKAKADPGFRDRLLHHISCIVTECVPKMPDPGPDFCLSDGESRDRNRVFSPHVDPCHPRFGAAVEDHLYQIVNARNMHSESHKSTCFKYSGNKKVCRMRFPRQLVEATNMDLDTGLIQVRRDNGWVNNYNACVALINRANHDVQFLYSQVDCLGKIYYVVKYVTKPEDDLHSKLTIAAAVRKDLEMQLKGHPEKSVGRTMLTKVLYPLCPLG